MRRMILFIGILAVCGGQQCGQPTQPTDSGQQAGSQVASGGIPEGVYTGVRSVTSVVDFVGDSQPPSESQVDQPFSQAFGANGTLVGPGGTPTVVGGVRSAMAGLGSIEETVKTVNVDANSLVIITDARMEMRVSDSTTLILTGLGQEIYTFYPPNLVVYESDMMLASDVVDGGFFKVEYSYYGELTK